MGYAAACIVLLSLGAYVLYRPQTGSFQVKETASRMIKKTNPKGLRSKITLPDNSVVYLGPGSSISFPEQFSTEERSLTLSGEAFFEIAKDAARPFTVHTGEIKTQVLGTSFKIKAYQNSPLFVEVATGKVKVGRNILTPGKGIIWHQQTGQIENISTNIAAIQRWTSGEMTFSKRSLAEITTELENWYNVSIHLDHAAMDKKHFSLSIDGRAPLTDALDIICNTAHLKYHAKGKHQFIISNH